MNPAERLLRTEQIFSEVIAIGEPDRTRILDTRCAGDTTLMAELRNLLRACEAEEVHRGALQSARAVKSEDNARIGPYVLDRLLGRGGMGAVYLAHRVDGQFAQQVAIKLIDLPLATDHFRERFRTERQILAGLSHPYIARLLDGGVSQQGDLYLAMEYVDGVSITTYSDTHHPSVRERVTLFRKVCEPVQYAHQNLVVHRDLKPDNILITPDGTPRLLDFGTAKMITPSSLDGDLTRPGMQTFTPRYASPEQVLGRPITIASDIYSLGVLLYVLLSGSMPYELTEFTTEEMVEVVCRQQPPRPGSLPSSPAALDADLDAIILKALRKDPAERYATVDHLSADLQAWLEKRPVAARRGDLRYRASRFLRRNSLLVAAAAIIVLLAVAGVAGIAWQAHVANRNFTRAEASAADLRELSVSLLSELDDALKQIPGSTGAQQLLVTRVLQHLDRLAKDRDGDRATKLAVIDAYTRLGNVQGNIYYQNVADRAGAITSFNRALALAERLVAANPNDKEALRSEAAALEARGETLSDAGDALASVASLQAAVNLYNRFIQLPGTTAADIFEAAIANETLGDELGEDIGLSDVVACEAAYRRTLAMDERALKLDPNYMPVRRGIPFMHMHLGNVMLDTDPAQSLTELGIALQLQSALPQDQQQRLTQVRLRGVILRKQADAESELGHYAAAVPLFEQARQIFQRLLDADPKNVAALTDMTRFFADEAQMENFAADPLLAEVPTDERRHRVAALEALQKDAAVVRQIMEEDSSHKAWVQELARIQLHIDTIRRQLGQPVQDPASAARELAVLRQAAQAPNSSANDIDLAVQAILEEPTPAPADRQDAVAWAEHGVELTHGHSPSSYLLLASAYRANRQFDLSADSSRKGLALLPDQEAGQSSFRLRKQLVTMSGATGRKA